MVSTAISARDLKKKYRLFSSPAARLKEALHPFRKRYHHEHWALKGVSFDIQSGETFGIVGRNGSGKSTLLQIIAGVLTPTSGTIAVNGRVAALLELGAGFNPEFTGRENVLLNGAIMRVPRDEMAKRMTEIEEFADIGEFFDQPVKTYSSGMFARVAFAAAITVDPDILIVDEALAVGDAKFQHKCYERMRRFAAQGRTVLFVTHSIDIVVAHCTRALVLENGAIDYIGDPRTAVDRYMQIMFGRQDSAPPEHHSRGPDAQPRPGSRSERPEWARVLRAFDAPNDADRCVKRASYNPSEIRVAGRTGALIVDYVIEAEERFDTPWVTEKAQAHIYFKVRFSRTVARPIFGIALKTLEGIVVYATNTFMLGAENPSAGAGDAMVASFSLPLNVQTGGYFLDLGVAEVDGTPGGAVLEIRRSVAHLEVRRVGSFPTFDGICDLHPAYELVR